MNEGRFTKVILLVIAGCLLLNTITFALPAAYKAINNEIAWMEVEKNKRIEEAKESERLKEAYKMCTKERVSLYNAAFAFQGREIGSEISEKLMRLPNEGAVPATLNLYLAKNYHSKNPSDIALPLTINDCIETWPAFPKFQEYAKSD